MMSKYECQKAHRLFFIFAVTPILGQTYCLACLFATFKVQMQVFRWVVPNPALIVPKENYYIDPTI
jgi:hypothetical protein